MAPLTVALLQMTSCGADVARNQAKGAGFCRQAAAMGADIALFPEMWSNGYSSFVVPEDAATNVYRAPQFWTNAATHVPVIDPEARQTWLAGAVESGGAFVTSYRDLARDLNMAIAITYLQRWPGAPRNAVSLIDRRGEIAFTYAKLHTCDFSLGEASCTPGDDFYVSTIDTAAGPVSVGAMICYDREFPESARILMLKGAEIILTPNACELEANRIGQFRARAAENMLDVAMANYARPEQNGHSVAFHPIAFDRNGVSQDTCVIEAGEEEGVFLACFDLEALRSYRLHETWGNAFRRPHRYSLLTSLEVREPFVRVDAGGDRYDTTKR